jgi:hypothetical protein
MFLPLQRTLASAAPLLSTINPDTFSTVQQRMPLLGNVDPNSGNA